MPRAQRRVGRYEIVRVVGRGGMALVYLARQPDLDRDVALKELAAFHASDAALAERFLRESRLAGSLSHPNIVTVYDYFECEGTPYICMEYLRRGSLRPWVGNLTVAQAVGVLEGLLAGLAHAATAGIVHRDLKPENVMVTSDGRVKITDFGIAKAYTSVAGDRFQTATGTTVGTPTYMAPEQAMARRIGPCTDLYSVGVMAYEMLTGRVPFGGADTPLAILLRHVNDPVPPPRGLNPNLDPKLAEWIEGLLVKDPGRRTQSAIEAWDSLEETIIDILGPRWRRQARLLEGEPTAGTPRPLAPARFHEATLAGDGASGQDAPRRGPSFRRFERKLEATSPAGRGAAPSQPLSMTVDSPTPVGQRDATGATASGRSAPSQAGHPDPPGPGGPGIAPSVPLPARPFGVRRVPLLATLAAAISILGAAVVGFVAARSATPPQDKRAANPAAAFPGPGGKIAFSRGDDPDTAGDIYAINPDGSGLERLTSANGVERSASFSPDGQRIAFWSNLNGPQIWLMNADGSAQAPLLGPAGSDAVAWSPDGGSFAYTNPSVGISIVRVGRGASRLAGTVPGDAEPSWSPDGQRIAFRSIRDGNQEIYVIDAKGGTASNRTSNPSNDRDPNWSPDGARIVFTSKRDGNFEIYVMGADGSAPEARTDNAVDSFDPSFSPDGRLVVFERGGDIYIGGANDRSLPRRLTADRSYDFQPEWQDSPRPAAPVPAPAPAPASSG